MSFKLAKNQQVVISVRRLLLFLTHQWKLWSGGAGESCFFIEMISYIAADEHPTGLSSPSSDSSGTARPAA
jgi:hypothetical protein